MFHHSHIHLFVSIFFYFFFPNGINQNVVHIFTNEIQYRSFLNHQNLVFHLSQKVRNKFIVHIFKAMFVEPKHLYWLVDDCFDFSNFQSATTIRKLLDSFLFSTSQWVLVLFLRELILMQFLLISFFSQI
jgi:hypothetical protein